LLKALGEAGEGARLAGELRGNAVLIRTGNFVPNEQTSKMLQAFLSGPKPDEREVAVNKCLADSAMPRDLLGRPFAIEIILTGANQINTRRLVIDCLRRNKQPI
jgi:hypothetical protein